MLATPHSRKTQIPVDLSAHDKTTSLILTSLSIDDGGYINGVAIEETIRKQGRIHGNPVADGWAGAVMQKPLAIQNCYRRTDGRTDLPTRQGEESRVRD